VVAAASASSINSVAKSPGGVSASRQTCSTARAQPATFGACLSRQPLPAASAGAANRNTWKNGKFHGMIASTTPAGS